MMVELEDILGGLFAKIRPELEGISRMLFTLEARLDQGILCLEDFLLVKNQIARIRVEIEDLPLLAEGTTALQGCDTGAGVAS